MTTTMVPHISEVNPNSPEFSTALGKAGRILAGTGLSVYSRHRHYPLATGEVLFEEPVAPGHLVLYPLDEATAAGRGLPSCWGVGADGGLTVLRYASRSLHAASGIDLTGAAFLAQLAEAGQAFAAAGLHDVLEINVASHLFPAGEGRITYEVTDEPARMQQVTTVPTPPAIAGGDWAQAACWSFEPDGTPLVQGMCNGVTRNMH